MMSYLTIGGIDYPIDQIDPLDVETERYSEAGRTFRFTVSAGEASRVSDG